MMRSRLRLFRADRTELYLVTDRSLRSGRELIEAVEASVASGVGIVQLREKTAPGREFVDLARTLLARLRPLGVPLIVNDRIDVALAAGADGVHIGQQDIAPEDARRLLGPEAFIGLTVETLEEARAVDPALVDHVGASVFSTGTKTDVRGVFGLEGMRVLVRLLPVPVVAIGGIHPGNAAEVAATGVAGVAVVSAVLGAPSPGEAAGVLVGCLRGRTTA